MRRTLRDISFILLCVMANMAYAADDARAIVDGYMAAWNAHDADKAAGFLAALRFPAAGLLAAVRFPAAGLPAARRLLAGLLAALRFLACAAMHLSFRPRRPEPG